MGWPWDTSSDGTLTRVAHPGGATTTRSPGAAGVGDVPADLVDRFQIVLQLSAAKMPGEIAAQFKQLLEPVPLAIMAGTLAVWGGSHFFGVGFVVDAILVGVGIITLGMTALQAANELYSSVTMTVSAERRADLHAASGHFAKFVTLVGVEAVVALLTRGAAKSAKSGHIRRVENAASSAGKVKAAGFLRVVADDIVRAYGSALQGRPLNAVEHDNLAIALKFFANVEQSEAATALATGKINSDILGRLRGIDLSSPVDILELPAGSKLTMLAAKSERNSVHFHHPTATETSRLTTTGTGQWLGRKGASARQRGLADGLREERVFVFQEPTLVLKSKAAPIGDHWTPGRIVSADVWPSGPVVSRATLGSEAGLDVPSLSKRAAVPVEGGGSQYFVPKNVWDSLASSGGVKELGGPGRPKSPMR